MKLVSEAKLEQLFAVMFNEGIKAGFAIREGDDDPKQIACRYQNAVSKVMADCHPEEPLAADVVKLRDSA